MDLFVTRAGLIVACCIALIALVARADLFSPGELAKPHEKLEGLSQCTKCHPAGGQLSQDNCLSCHAELKPRIAQNAGLHGKISGEKRNCELCHREHLGLNAKLIDWGAGTGKPAGENDFNHLRTGWALKGAHLDLKCSSCHEKRRVLWPVAVKLLSVRPETRLGLGTACEQCHFDEHRGQQQEDCEYCHVEKAWKPAPNFNHDDTAYPLKGKHAKVKCSGCHDSEKDGEPHGFPSPKSETFLRFAPVEHRTCLDCHRDPHEGRFGLRCQSCHTVEGWHVLRNASAEREFHQKTRFPLEGAHLDVDCKSCHGPFPGQPAKFKGLPHEGCNSCHVDAHVGQMPVVAPAKLPDCATCHSVQGFTPTKFGMLEHAKTRFPLDGAHVVVPCASCHPPTASLRAKIPRPVLADLAKKKRQELFSPALFDFTKPLDKCESCHRDVHDGQFVPRTCVTCHPAGAASFKGEALRFNHGTTAFPLEGAHVKVKCEQCHFAPAPGAIVKYKPLPQTCASCHLDVHAGQFASTSGGRTAKSCETCHGNTSWKQLLFEHKPPFTTFLLDGQHAKAKCEACHRSVPVGPKVNVWQYRALPLTCEGCHSDFHKGAFKGFEP
ncbi:MAG: hypothetical protein QM817_01070 [Archangium sp.]